MKSIDGRHSFLKKRLSDLKEKIFFHKDKFDSMEKPNPKKVAHIEYLLERLNELAHYHSINEIELSLLEKYLGYSEDLLTKILESNKHYGRQHHGFLMSNVDPKEEKEKTEKIIKDYKKGVVNLSVYLGTDDTSEKLEFSNDGEKSKLEEETKIIKMKKEEFSKAS
ncbi:MAG: hypothetical protein N4A44_00465 [Alphaproteobacteria bacterium]|jgi:hypothetical protein|nr:hypothetical protein [Alphaproteobacteria bacterium]